MTTYRRARVASGMTPEEAAHVLGLTVDELMSCERGELMPDALTLRHMAQAYGVSADALVGLDELRVRQSEGASARRGTN